MGAPWQDADQKAFTDAHLASYWKHVEAQTTKSVFWPQFLAAWFETWPLPEPPCDAIEKEGSVEKAAKVERDRKIAVSTISILVASARTYRVSAAAETCIQSSRR